MSFLVLNRKCGESLILSSGHHFVSLTIRDVRNNRVKIGYSSSCDVKIDTGIEVIDVSKQYPVIISHAGHEIEISGLKDELGRNVNIFCSLSIFKNGQSRIGVEAPQCIEILRDELLSTEVVA